MEPVVGIEPTTYGLRNRCSTTELHWLVPGCPQWNAPGLKFYPARWPRRKAVFWAGKLRDASGGWG